MSEPLTDAEIVKLVQLEKDATPVPWEALLDPTLFPSVRIGPPLPHTDNSGICEEHIAVNAGPSPEMVAAGCCDGTTMETVNANAQLIALTRNALPRLLAERAEDKAEIKQLQKQFHVNDSYLSYAELRSRLVERETAHDLMKRKVEQLQAARLGCRNEWIDKCHELEAENARLNDYVTDLEEKNR